MDCCVGDCVEWGLVFLTLELVVERVSFFEGLLRILPVSFYLLLVLLL